MTTYFRRTSITSVLTAVLMAGAAMSPAYAQEEGRQFSAAAGETVNDAITLAKDGQKQEAVNSLQKAIASPDLTAFERSTIYQMLGQFSYQLDRPVEAQENFEQAINAGGLLPKEIESTNVTIAQLMIQNGQYRDGAQRLEAYLNSGGQEKPGYLDLLINAWIQAEEYKRALPWAKKWFKNANPKARKHFDLLNFLFNKLGMQDRQADIVKDMINRWPEDRTLWEAWASILANGGREAEAFEVNKMLYLGGALTSEADLLKVVQYYSFYEMPYQAAEILERELSANRISRTPDRLKELSNLFRQAREYKRAIPILEEAASQSGEAKLYADLGEALYNEGDCQRSEAAFSEAIDRGYNAGKSWMLIANCRYDQTTKLDRLNCEMSDTQMSDAPITKARKAAVTAFNKVPASSSERDNARKWVTFIKAEKDAVDRRCEFQGRIVVETCFAQIRLGYKQAFMTGGELKLEDETCRQYREEFDIKYRPKIAQE